MTEEELRVLAWTLLGEAAGEGSHGMEAVAHVIRNRSLSGRFPSNPASAALQANSAGVHQFSTWNPLSNGGNIPRARYPAGSTEFNKALSIVEKVFGPTPGKDPTQGATHYYSPKGMANGAPPYWWRDEASRGEKRIGGHVFAVRRVADRIAPTPATRAADALGRFPTEPAMTAFRSGQPAQLPANAPANRVAPTPARMSVQMQEDRLRGDAEIKSTTTLIYDPVAKTLVPKMPTARMAIEQARTEQQAQRAPTAKQVQRVAGFAVPQGVDGIRQVDAARAAPVVSASDKVRAAAKLPTTKAQTQFAPNIAQPAGSLATKDQSRLAPGAPLAFQPSASDLARAAGRAAVAPKVAPVPQMRPALPKVAVPLPPPPLRIVVDGANPIAETIKTSPAFAGTSSGKTYVPGQTYQGANGVMRANADGSFTNVNTGQVSVGSSGGSDRDTSPGGHKYDRTTGTWI